MDNEKIKELLSKFDALGDGFFVHALDTFINGQLKVNRKGVLTVPLQFDASAFDHPSLTNDVRCIMRPHVWDCKLIPLIVFVDPEIVFGNNEQPPVN